MLLYPSFLQDACSHGTRHSHRLLAGHAWVEVSLLLDVFSDHLSPSITKPDSQQGTDLVDALLQQAGLILALKHNTPNLLC